MKAISNLVTENRPQLIPSFKKPERRLLSVFMSVMEIVPEFRGEILKYCGYGSGKTCSYKSYMEPHFSAPNLPRKIPDGLIVCQRGAKTWSAFIEAKADGNPIRPDQIQEYADLAQKLAVDSVISISNEYAASSKELPYHLAGNKRRQRKIFHLSWSEIRNAIGLFIGSKHGCNSAEIAVLQHAIRYMGTDKSGVETFDAMPADWPNFVESADTAMGFQSTTPGLTAIVQAWEQERRDLCTKLNGIIPSGVDIRHAAGNRASPSERRNFEKKLLSSEYALIACFQFKENKSTLKITSDLKACSHIFELEINTPEGKKAKATISWLVEKLEGLDPEMYQIFIDWPGRGGRKLIDLHHFIRFPESHSEGQKKCPKSVALVHKRRDSRRFKSRKRFIEDLESCAINIISMALKRDLITV